jgi:phage FluMu protein Com
MVKCSRCARTLFEVSSGAQGVVTIVCRRCGMRNEVELAAVASSDSTIRKLSG